MIQSILDNFFPILLGVFILFVGLDFYGKFIKKDRRTVEPEDLMRAYSEVVRKRKNG